MNNFEGILTALASVVVILTGLITAVTKISGAHPLRWIRTRTIDRFKAWVEAPRREIEQLQLGLAALQQEQRAVVDRVEEQLLAQQNETAEHLVLSLHTVKLHVKHLLAKLGATNRTQAVARARTFHLLTREEDRTLSE
jgi:LuxR family transcriptional regulator, maltose regulon positive regulatory protein